MTKKLLRLVRIAPLAILLASSAYAQTTGTIIGVVTDASTGKPVEGAVVIATSSALQGEQTAITGKDGSYRLAVLPGGQYKLMVQIAGFKPAERSDIRLSVDKTLRANMAVVPEAVQLEEQVVRTGVAPVVNVGSAEVGAVVSRDFISNVPVGRNFQAIAVSVPQAQNDSYGVGFAGAQSAENGYIVDGLNVTDPVYGAAAGTFTGRSAPTLLSNFIQEVDVKTGSFMPEYGRSTGGIINVVTRSGSNEFHGSVFSNYRADSLVTPDGKVIGADGEATARFSKPSGGAYNLDFGGEVGGPILKDRLWFYAGFAPIIQKNYYERFQRTNVLNTDPGQASCSTVSATDPRCRDGSGLAIWNKVPGSETKVSDGQTSYQWSGKLTYLINSENRLSLSTYGQPSTLTVHNFTRPQDGNADNKTAIDSYDVVASYNGKFFQNRMIVSFDGGWHGQRIEDLPTDYQSTRPAVNWSDPQDYFSLTAFEPVAGCNPATQSDVYRCPTRGYATGGFPGGIILDQKINRYAGRLSVGGVLSAAGQHSAKVGIDLERNDYDQLKRYSGGYAVTARGNANANAANRHGQFRATRGYGFLAGGVPTSNLAEVFPTGTLTTKSYSDSYSYFLQDSWQVLGSGLTVNAGVRLETQKLVNRENAVDRLNVNDSWAPRVQGIWDFTGNGRGKVSANWGRFFYAIPLDMGDRSFGNEREINFRQRFDCFSGLPTGGGASLYAPATGTYGQFDPRNLVNASGGPFCTNTATQYDAQAGSGARFTQTGQSATPVQPGLKAPYVDMFGSGVEYEVLSDLSVGLEYTGRRQGRIIEDMSPDDGSQYFIANPGDNKTWDYNGTRYSARDAVAFDSATGRTLSVPFPKPERSYDGLTFRVTKNYSRNWLAQASYTYSVLRGNYPGPFLADYGGAGQGQLDPAITAAYDLPTLVSNTKGLLPGDRPHQVKLFGAYTWNVSPRFSVTGGAGYTGQSGRPNNALGAHEVYGLGLGYIIQQGSAGRTPFTHQVDLKGGLGYVLRAPYELKFSVDIFNVLNSQETLLYDQNYTLDFVQPIQGVSCKQGVVGKTDPVGALQASCPDVAFLKTIDGRPVVANANWGKALNSSRAFQTPIQMRLGLSLAF